MDNLKLEVNPCRVLMLTLDGQSTRIAFKRRFRHVPALETWAPDFSLGSPAASALWSLTLWTAAELDRSNSPLQASPRTANAVTRSLRSLFLDVLDEKYPFHSRKTEDLAELHVRRIEGWIDANLAEPMGVEEMAAVVDVTSRSIQTAFRRLRGCTPMQYLRRRRLEEARRLLENATPETTVTNVALDSGLFHLGRFSAAYRAMFGEKPSETLARSRGHVGASVPAAP
jgi:AraC-like DNA-binding protein